MSVKHKEYSMDKIIMRDVEIYGCHGVAPEEKVNKQPFVIDVEMEADLKKPGISDNLEDTVSYSAVNKLITRIVQNTSFDLVERLAEELCCAILQNYEKVAKVKLCVKKPQAPMSGNFIWVGVEIERSRATA
jgi:dihydroneopterin aldolase